MELNKLRLNDEQARGIVLRLLQDEGTNVPTRIPLRTYVEAGWDAAVAHVLSVLSKATPGEWRPSNPYHKTGDFGHGEESWNEQPEFQAFEEGVSMTLSEVPLATEAAKREGMQKVYSWLLQHGHIFPGHLTSELNELKAQIKEWGLAPLNKEQE